MELVIAQQSRFTNIFLTFLKFNNIFRNSKNNEWNATSAYLSSPTDAVDSDDKEE